MVMAGGFDHFGLLSAFVGLEGHPAATAAALATDCLMAGAMVVVVLVFVVVEVDLAADGLLLKPPVAAKIPTAMAAMKKMTSPRRMFARRFRWRSSSASRAARAAFCRARFSCLGTARHHIGAPGGGPNGRAGV